MKDNSSSTSSSDASTAAQPTLRSVLTIALVTLVSLVVLDVAVGLATRMPRDPRERPNTLQRYFDYGRSVESKLRMRVGETIETSTPVIGAGWLESPEPVAQAKQPSAPGKVLLAVYGQSFTHQAADLLVETDPRFELRKLGGPAAPLAHSYTMYQQDRREHDAQVAVIGIVAGTLPMLVTMTPMTVMFEDPYPYTYPRYFLRDGKLESYQPQLRSFAGLRAALDDPQQWKRFETDLRDHDLAYDDFVFEADWLDYSTLGRAVRRGYAQKQMRAAVARYVSPHGLRNQDGLVDTATALLLEFAKTARADGRLPYVLLFQDAGTGNSLAASLGPALEQNDIGYLSSFAYVPPSDSGNFLKDGHFRPGLMQRFVDAWHADLLARLAKAAPQ
jgi:hypothetical protein